MAEFGEPLSDRELDVLRCAAGGASNREIAAELSISYNTVKVHLRNVYTKLGVASRTEAATLGLQQGLIPLPGEELEPEPEREEELEEEEQETTAVAPVEAAVEPTRASMRPLWPAALLLLILAAVSFWGWQTFAGQAAAPTDTPPPFTEEAIGDSYWAISRALPTARRGMAVAAVGLQLYGIGGETTDGVVDDVAVFDTNELVWSTAAAKPTAVQDATAAVLFGEIYVPGGRLADGTATAVVEAYSPANDAWRPIAFLPQPVAGGLALSDGSFLYLFGGRNEDGYLDTAYVYDASLDRWRPLPPLAMARAFSAGAAAAGRLYMVGGMNEEGPLTDCQSFDPVAETWQDCPPLLQPRAHASGTAVLNKLYVIGGQGLAADAPFSELYDPNSETWQVINTPMLTAETPDWAGLGVAHIETRIYALGGERDGGLTADTFVYKPLVYQTFIPAASGGE